MVAVSLKKSFFQAEDGIRDRSPSRGLGDVYKRQDKKLCALLVTADLAESNSAWAISVRLLDPSSSRGI